MSYNPFPRDKPQLSLRELLDEQENEVSTLRDENADLKKRLASAQQRCYETSASNLTRQVQRAETERDAEVSKWRVRCEQLQRDNDRLTAESQDISEVVAELARERAEARRKKADDLNAAIKGHGTRQLTEGDVNVLRCSRSGCDHAMSNHAYKGNCRFVDICGCLGFQE